MAAVEPPPALEALLRKLAGHACELTCPTLPQPTASLALQLRHAPAFLWDTEVGGKAFDYTIAALRRRHLSRKSLHFGPPEDGTHQA